MEYVRNLLLIKNGILCFNNAKLQWSIRIFLFFYIFQLNALKLQTALHLRNLEEYQRNVNKLDLPTQDLFNKTIVSLSSLIQSAEVISTLPSYLGDGSLLNLDTNIFQYKCFITCCVCHVSTRNKEFHIKLLCLTDTSFHHSLFRHNLVLPKENIWLIAKRCNINRIFICVKCQHIIIITLQCH